MRVFLLVALIFLSTGAIAAKGDEEQLTRVPRPLLIVYQKPGDATLTVHAMPPLGYSPDRYAVILVGVVKYLSASYDLDEAAMWDLIEQARRNSGPR